MRLKQNLRRKILLNQSVHENLNFKLKRVKRQKCQHNIVRYIVFYIPVKYSSLSLFEQTYVMCFQTYYYLLVRVSEERSLFKTYIKFRRQI